MPIGAVARAAIRTPDVARLDRRRVYRRAIGFGGLPVRLICGCHRLASACGHLRRRRFRWRFGHRRRRHRERGRGWRVAVRPVQADRPFDAPDQVLFWLGRRDVDRRGRCRRRRVIDMFAEQRGGLPARQAKGVRVLVLVVADLANEHPKSLSVPVILTGDLRPHAPGPKTV